LPFSFYTRLTKAQKKIYDESDRIGNIELYHPERHRESISRLAAALAGGDRAATQTAAQTLVDGLAAAFGVPPVRVRVLERRPSWQTGEVHGLYQADEKGLIQVSLWMRTAQRAQVVKFKTFLRTLLHELCHHLDYHRFRLRDSFHTEGFYRRESSLLRQLHPESSTPGTPSSGTGSRRPPGLRGRSANV
jgi:hypothetical protein